MFGFHLKILYNYLTDSLGNAHERYFTQQLQSIKINDFNHSRKLQANDISNVPLIDSCHGTRRHVLFS